MLLMPHGQVAAPHQIQNLGKVTGKATCSTAFSQTAEEYVSSPASKVVNYSSLLRVMLLCPVSPT